MDKGGLTRLSDRFLAGVEQGILLLHELEYQAVRQHVLGGGREEDDEI